MMVVLDDSSLDTQTCTRVKEALLLQWAGRSSQDGNAIETRQKKPLHVEALPAVSAEPSEPAVPERVPLSYHGQHQHACNKYNDFGICSVDEKHEYNRPAADNRVASYRKQRDMDPTSTMETNPESKDVADTQIMSQEVYDKYYSEREPSKHLDFTSNYVELANGINNRASETYATGEIGHVNLALETEGKSRDHRQAVEDYENTDELGLYADTQIMIETTTSPHRLLTSTPAIAGRKRDHQGNVRSPVGRTPGMDLAAMFSNGRKDVVMGLSQLFAQTQAPSSPFVGAPRSDPIFERPSPGFPGIEYSSPIATMSSPVLPRRIVQRATTEPRDIYVPLKVSQEQRAYKEHHEELEILQPSSPRNSDDEVEPDEDPEQKRAERRRQKAKAESELMNSFERLRAPTLRRKVDRRRKFIERETVSNTGKTAKTLDEDVILISDDASLAQPEERICTSEVDSMDEYDELSQTVNPTKRDDGGSSYKSIQVPKTITKWRVKGSPARLMCSLGRVHGSSPNGRMERGVLANQGQQSLPEEGTIQDRLDARETQTSAVPETQPLPPRPLLYSSYNSKTFVSQSQGLSLSHNLRAQLPVTPVLSAFQSSSIPPAPPLPRQVNVDTANAIQRDSPGSSLSNFPSSPPIAARLNIGNASLEHVIASDLSDKYKLGTTPVLSKSCESIQFHGGQEQFLYTPVGSVQSRRLGYSIPESSPAAMLRTQSLDELTVDHNLPTSYARFASFPGPRCMSRMQENASHARSPSAGVYHTAQTHQCASAAICQPSLPQLRAVNKSPAMPRLRKMSEIAADLSATEPSKQAVDIDINIMNDDDIEFQDVVSRVSSLKERTTKKRKGDIYGRALREPAKEINTMAPPTPPSIRRREKLRSAVPAGARHANTSQQTRARPRVVKSKGTSTKGKGAPQTDQNAVKTPQNEPPDDRPKIAETPQTAQEDSPTPPQRTATKTIVATVTSEVQDDPKLSERPGNPSLQTPAQLSTSTTVLSGEPFLPSRVFARFRGTVMAFYPGTCLGLVSPGATSYVIRFDDGTTDNVQPSLVRSLDLRIGDLVRVDMRGMRTKSYVVRGLRDQIKDVLSESNGLPQTDIRGHETVVVEVKARASCPGDGRLQISQPISVPITSIYLIGTMWPCYADRLRVFDYIPNPGNHDTRMQTPVDMPPAPTIPSSRSRRHTLLPVVYPAASVPRSLLDSPSSIFSNMAFAITYSSKEEKEKCHVTRLILENGGRILRDGFDELFNPPTLFQTSPSKSPGRTITTNSHAFPTLTLTSTARKLGFTALIADAYSRRAKYMQALALNLPCLSGRWILDCIAHNQLLAWDRYLLPAGESAFLGGAVRSRTFSNSNTPTTNAGASRLKDTIEQRPRLLDGRSVVLVMGKGKAKEKRKAYLFLTHALGARRVERVRNVAAAKKLVERGEEWGWVYVEDGKVEGAREELLGDGREEGEKKRNRGADQTGVGDGDVRRGMVRVIGDEFVVQSLILGALMEE